MKRKTKPDKENSQTMSTLRSMSVCIGRSSTRSTSVWHSTAADLHAKYRGCGESAAWPPSTSANISSGKAERAVRIDETII